MNRTGKPTISLIALALLLTLPLSAIPQDAPSEDVESLVDGQNAFAFDLYHRVRTHEAGNVFFSPYSISTALGMAWAGARADTEAEMARVMHLTLAQEPLHAAVATLSAILQSRFAEEEAPEGETLRNELNIANAAWLQEDIPLNAAYVRLLAERYGSSENLVDFRNPDHAAALINAWTNEQTQGRIPSIVEPSNFDAETFLVLTNAIYFAGRWANAFTAEATQEDQVFHLLDGSESRVPLMNQMSELRYGEGDGYQIVVLPYVGGELEMVVLLPAEGQFERVEAELGAERLSEMLTRAGDRDVSLSLPRFSLSASLALKSVLEEMGMEQAFQAGAADFTGMAELPIYIQQVLHKATLEVDEAGTVATAATAVVMGVETTAYHEPPVVFRADRPFITVIRDAGTGTVLFLGRVLTP